MTTADAGVQTLSVVTEMGSFEIVLDTAAPETCNYFAIAASNGVFDDGSIFRIVSREQTEDSNVSTIDVVQVGTQLGLGETRHAIPHEHTGVTGIHHEKWVVSAARYRPGELYYSFFICMKDQPELDKGGSRQADGEGFAAFGRVSSGFDVVASIFDCAESHDELVNPIHVNRIDAKSSKGVNTCTKHG